VFSTDKIILVTGATGKQGGATASALLTDGWRVRALVRDPDAAPARALADAGAELVTGDLADRASLDAATSGAHGVFSVQPTPGAPNQPADFRPEDEVTQGNNVAEAAHAAGVAHLVYTSVIGADRPTGMPNVDNKLAIEQRIRELGVPATILRPVSFMENYTTPYGLPGGALATGIRPDVSQRLIAVRDVGAFAALAFGHPDATRDRRCTVCHVAGSPEKTRSDGVACEACHGPAEEWLGTHTRQNSHEASVKAGMIDTKNLEVRAKTCLACHLGVPGPGAAGAPCSSPVRTGIDRDPAWSMDGGAPGRGCAWQRWSGSIPCTSPGTGRRR